MWNAKSPCACSKNGFCLAPGPSFLRQYRLVLLSSSSPVGRRVFFSLWCPPGCKVSLRSGTNASWLHALLCFAWKTVVLRAFTYAGPRVLFFPACLAVQSPQFLSFLKQKTTHALSRGKTCFVIATKTCP